MKKGTEEELDVIMTYMYNDMVIDSIQQLVNPFAEEGVGYHGVSRLLTEQQFNVLLDILHESFREVPIKFVFIPTRRDFIKKCFHLHYTCKKDLAVLVNKKPIQEYKDSYQHYMYFYEFNLGKLPKHQATGFLMLYILVALYMVKHRTMPTEKKERKAIMFAIRKIPKIIEEFIKRI